MALYKTTVTIILVTLLAIPRQGTAQDTQEAFSQLLIAACQETDVPVVKEPLAHPFFCAPFILTGDRH